MSSIFNTDRVFLGEFNCSLKPLEIVKFVTCVAIQYSNHLVDVCLRLNRYTHH